MNLEEKQNKTNEISVGRGCTFQCSCIKSYLWKGSPQTSRPQLEKHLLVIHKGEHEQPLLDALLPLRPFSLEVTVGVIGHDHSLRLVRQLHDEAVVIADHSLAPNSPRWREDNYFTSLEIHQDVLIWECKQSCLSHYPFTLYITVVYRYHSCIWAENLCYVTWQTSINTLNCTVKQQQTKNEE